MIKKWSRTGLFPHCVCWLKTYSFPRCAVFTKTDMCAHFFFITVNVQHRIHRVHMSGNPLYNFCCWIPCIKSKVRRTNSLKLCCICHFAQGLEQENKKKALHTLSVISSPFVLKDMTLHTWKRVCVEACSYIALHSVMVRHYSKT